MKLLDFFTDGTMRCIDIKACLKSLKEQNQDSIIKLYTEIGIIQPSENLSKKIGFDIHENWVMPFPEWNHEDVELLALTVRDDEKATENLFTLLAGYNPKMNLLIKLSTLENKSYKMMSIILGVTSKFNYDDIKEYIQGGFGAIKYNDPHWASRMKKLESIYGHSNYVMSNRTLDIVFERLGLNPIKITVYSGKTIASKCKQQMHPEDEVLSAKSMIDLKMSSIAYSNSPDFVSAIKYIAAKEGIETEFFLDGVSHGSDIEPIFENFNKALDLLNELAHNEHTL